MCPEGICPCCRRNKGLEEFKFMPKPAYPHASHPYDYCCSQKCYYFMMNGFARTTLRDITCINCQKTFTIGMNDDFYRITLTTSYKNRWYYRFACSKECYDEFRLFKQCYFCSDDECYLVQVTRDNKTFSLCEHDCYKTFIESEENSNDEYDIINSDQSNENSNDESDDE